MTHFVRPNCLRLEWLGVPLSKRDGAGKVEHRILLAIDGLVTVADKMADGSWYRGQARTVFAALRDDRWRSGIGNVVIPILLNNHNYLREIGHSHIQVSPSDSGGVVCKFKDPMYSWDLRTSIEGEIVEYNSSIFGRNDLKTHLVGKTYIPGRSSKFDTWMNSSDIFIHTLNFHSVEFDKGPYLDVFESYEGALSPLLPSETYSNFDNSCTG